MEDRTWVIQCVHGGRRVLVIVGLYVILLYILYTYAEKEGET